MKAHWLDDTDTPREPIPVEILGAEGVHYQALDPDPARYQGVLDALRTERGYTTQDEVALGPNTDNLEAICAKFLPEHHHDEDEVRFVLAGAGVFDIRSRDDRWMRVEVETGDLIVVPAGRHHRFFLTPEKTIRCLRLFQDPSGWVPHYR